MQTQIDSLYVLKQTILEKLSYAVISSVGSHVIFVFLYASIANFTFETSEWFKSVFDNVTAFSTWLCIIPFISIIFAQVVICANVYVLKSTYQVTRFRKFISFISLRTLLVCVLHLAIGGGEIWLYLFISKSDYKDMYVKCNEHYSCLQETSFFLIFSGIWAGLYYFIYFHMTNRNIIFPVIQQGKLSQYKAKLLPLLKDSIHSAIYPSIYYFILYYLFGSQMQALCTSVFQQRFQIQTLNIYSGIFVWIFTSLYIINMNLMRFFFELFLTETIANIDNDTLSTALSSTNVPILQHLACLDLYLLSKWSPQRRQALYTLHQPGAHPHAWNSVFRAALQVIAEFIEILNKSNDNLLVKDEVRPMTSQYYEYPSLQMHMQSPSLKSPIRNMSDLSCFMQSPQSSNDLVQVTVETKFKSITEIMEYIRKMISELFNRMISKVASMRFIKYLFGELPEAHIQHCLTNGQLVIWTCHGLANIAVASYTEDPYGIVQNDLHILIKVLVQLKLSMEKLNKLSMFSQKSKEFDYFTFKMKNYVYSGVKLSLYNICNTFGKHFNDISLPKDIVLQLQNYF